VKSKAKRITKKNTEITCKKQQEQQQLQHLAAAFVFSLNLSLQFQVNSFQFSVFIWSARFNWLEPVCGREEMWRAANPLQCKPKYFK